MSFIYSAPLHLAVSAHIVHGQLRFRGQAALLVKFRDERALRHGVEEASPARSFFSEQQEHETNVLPVVAAWRGNGTSRLDPQWWQVRDLGALDRGHCNRSHTRLTRLDFSTEAYTAAVSKRQPSPGDVALYDAFLEQDTIQLQVQVESLESFLPADHMDDQDRVNFARARPVCLASILIKLSYY
jgi:hypothetical protein